MVTKSIRSGLALLLVAGMTGWGVEPGQPVLPPVGIPSELPELPPVGIPSELPELPEDGGGSLPGLPQQLSGLRAQLDAVLQAIHVDYAELLAKEDKTFEDLQALAELRAQLLGISAEAKVIVDQMQLARDTFLPNRPQRPNRPELGEDENAAVSLHRTAMQALAGELEAILQEGSPEYAALADKPGKTLDDIKAMQELRQELLSGSATAQEKLAEMQETASQFRQDNPALQVGLPKAVEGIAQRARAMQALRETADEILAESSPRYGELLGKQNKTAAEIGELARQRRQLLAENQEAQQLQNAARLMHDRVSGTVRQIREDRVVPDDDAAGE